MFEVREIRAPCSRLQNGHRVSNAMAKVIFPEIAPAMARVDQAAKTLMVSAKNKTTTPKTTTKAETMSSGRRPNKSPVKVDISKLNCDEWYVDSGAMQHMTNRREWFSEYKPFTNPKSMDSAKNGVTLQALGSGRVAVQTYDGHNWNEHSFVDVWFCPDGALNLFSMKKAGQKGIDQDIRDNGSLWTLLKDKEPIAIAVSPLEGDLYRMAVSRRTREDVCCRRIGQYSTGMA